MPRPAKRLDEHVREGTFRSRRHHELLAGPAVPWPQLAALQGKYNASDHELVRRAIGVEFERAAEALAQELSDDELEAELEAILTLPPAPFLPEENRQRSIRFARQTFARELRADGLSYKEVGERLGVSPATARRYVVALS